MRYTLRVSIAMTLCALATLGACAVPSSASCSVSIDADRLKLDLQYALRIPDPYGESGKLTRVLCLDAQPDPAVLEGEDAFIDFVMAYEGQVALADIRDNGEIVAAGFQRGDEQVIVAGPFGGFEQVLFEGVNGPDGIVGTIVSKAPLVDQDPQSDTSFTVEMEMDLPIVGGW